MTTFVVIEFLEKAEVAIVSSNWIFHENGELKSYWPPFWRDGNKLGNAVRNADPPDSTWKSYDIKILKSYGSYAAARSRLPSHEKGKDSSSCFEPETKRNSRSKIKRKSVPDPDDGDASSDADAEERNSEKSTKFERHLTKIDTSKKKRKEKDDDSNSLKSFEMPKLIYLNQETEDSVDPCASMSPFNDDESPRSSRPKSPNVQRTLIDFENTSSSASRILKVNEQDSIHQKQHRIFKKARRDIQFRVHHGSVQAEGL